MLTDFVKVATMREIKNNTMVRVEVGEEDILLANVNGHFYAITDVCSHATGSLSMGKLLPDTCEVQCPIHVGRFDLRSGTPTALPAIAPVEAFEVRIEGGDVLVGPKQ